MPGTVIVLQEARVRATVGADGRWLMPLPPLDAGPAVFGTGNLTLSAVVAKGTPTTRVVISDVLVGEVWMCTGRGLGSRTQWGTLVLRPQKNSLSPWFH